MLTGVFHQKVVLIGGFSASTSLQNYLAKQLGDISKAFGYQIRLTKKMDIKEPLVDRSLPEQDISLTIFEVKVPWPTELFFGH